MEKYVYLQQLLVLGKDRKQPKFPLLEDCVIMIGPSWDTVQLISVGVLSVMIKKRWLNILDRVKKLRV